MHHSNEATFFPQNGIFSCAKESRFVNVVGDADHGVLMVGSLVLEPYGGNFAVSYLDKRQQPDPLHCQNSSVKRTKRNDRAKIFGLV